MILHFFYYFFLIDVILFGSFHVGPITLRVYGAIAMIIFLFCNYIKFKSEKLIKISRFYIVLILLFNFFFLISLLMNGDYNEYNFFHRFFSFHIVSIVCYYSVYFFVNDYKMIRNTMIVLSIILVLDSIITVLQFQNSIEAWAIGQIFGETTEMQGFLETHSQSMDYSIVPGLFGHVVRNAFYLSGLTPLIFVLFDRYNLWKRGLVIALSILTLLAIYAAQQRAAFVLVLLFYMFFFVNQLRNRPKYFFLFLIFGLVLLFMTFNFLDNIELGRLTKIESNDRTELNNNAFAFILSNFLWGGVVSFEKIAGASAHNIVLDAFISSGIIGFIIMMTLYFSTLIKSIGVIISSNRKYIDNHINYIAMSMIILLLYGLTHNTSYYTGEVILYIILALLQKGEVIYRKT